MRGYHYIYLLHDLDRRICRIDVTKNAQVDIDSIVYTAGIKNHDMKISPWINDASRVVASVIMSNANTQYAPGWFMLTIGELFEQVMKYIDIHDPRSILDHNVSEEEKKAYYGLISWAKANKVNARCGLKVSTVIDMVSKKGLQIPKSCDFLDPDLVLGVPR